VIFYEWVARLWKPDTVSGVIIDLRSGALKGQHTIRMLIPMDNAQAQLWCVPRDTWPNGQVSVFIVPHVEVAEAEVLGHAGIDYAVYDTDEVRIDGAPYNLPPSIWVSTLTPQRHTPATGIVFWSGEYQAGKTRRTVEFTMSEIKAIRRLEP
jgi:hypothetical protein